MTKFVEFLICSDIYSSRSTVTPVTPIFFRFLNSLKLAFDIALLSSLRGSYPFTFRNRVPVLLATGKRHSKTVCSYVT